MEELNFNVDFINVKDKQEIIRRLVKVFSLPDSEEWNWNWDAFQDYFTSLSSDSEIVREAKIRPKKIHLIVKNIQDVKKISEKDYSILLSVLEDETKAENKDIDEDIEFSYEIE